MAPRPTVRRERNNDYSAVGTAGRRTGVTLPQGQLDENGLEEITGLFSSPTKPSPLKQNPGANTNDVQNSTFEASEEMSGMDSSGLTPNQTLSARRSLGAPALPRLRSASPRKSGIGGTARRSNGFDIFSPSKDVQPADSEDHENTPTPTPIRVKPRRFDPSPDKRPLKEVVPNGAAITSKQTNDADTPVHQGDTIGFEAEQSERETAMRQASEKGEQAFEPIRKEPADSFPNEDDFQNPMGDDDVEDFLSGIDNTIHNAVPVSDARSKIVPMAAEKAISSIEPAPLTDLPPKPAGQRKSGRKRKSEELGDEAAADSNKQPVKKSRARKAEAPKGKGKQKVAPVMSQEFAPRQAVAQQDQESTPARLPGLTKDPNTHLSQRQQAELDQIIEKVKARPGKLKTLYVLKREKSKRCSADDVRAGRTVVKPLAYWSAEQCVYNEGAAGLELGSRIPLSSVKEVSHSTKGSDNNDDAASLNEYHEDGHEEPWEKQIGVFRGQASVWSQLDQTTLEDPEETDLAYHPSSMLTREVQGSGFKFAKLVSTPFFGSGIVDLPPGAVKKPKNSRTMHMCFFVFKGRVTVKIGQGIEEGECESFSIGKGGVFQVPRGNKYSIENVLENPARIFFSQGSETVPEG